MLLTGKRISALREVMRWEQIGADWFWDAPESTVKNKKLHGIPLPMLAQRLLSPRQSQGKVFDRIKPRNCRRDQATDGADDFIWHGIRHLVETKCAELQDAQGKPAISPYTRDLLFDINGLGRLGGRRLYLECARLGLSSGSPGGRHSARGQ